MKQAQAATLAATIQRDYPGKVAAQVQRVKSQRHLPPGGGYRVRALLVAKNAPRLAATLRYPSQVAKLRERWCWWLLSEAELAALPFPGDEDEGNDELAEAG